jgi:dihydroflavonol-4-reductase
MTDSPSTTTVLVTGATGYIARHVVAQLLDAGYVVRGTARKASSLAALKTDLTSAVVDAGSLNRFSIIEADLMSDAGWADAVAGCTYVHHVASPIPSTPPKDENELIRPAKEGTLRVLKASLNAGVKRVVITSSLAAVLYGVDRNKTFTEADWSNPNDPRIGAYEKSKVIAEKAAWDFMNTDAKGRMEMSTINPGGVLGPMIGNNASTSNELVKKLMDGSLPMVPDLTYSMVDVRDVAAAHVAAMTAPEAAGQRYLIGIENASMRDLAKIVHRHYSPKGYKVPTRNMPGFLMKVTAKFDKTVALALNDLSRPHHINNAKVTALLGRPLRDLETMTIGMADSFIAYGVVKPKKA